MVPSTSASLASVLYVNPTSDASPLLLSLVRALHGSELRYVVATFARDAGPLDAQLAGSGVEIHHLAASGSRGAPRAAARLRALLGHVRPDVLHTNMFVPGVVGEVARRSRRPIVPSVYTRHHDISHHLAGSRPHVALDRWTARLATRVVAPSGAVRSTLIELEGVPPASVTVVPHGLDLEGLRPPVAATTAWRRRLGGDPLLVCASRLDPLKGFPTLFRALARIAEVHPGVRLAVAGAAVTGFDDVVRLAAEEHRVQDRVDLLGHVQDVHALMSAADVYVSASEAESFGLSILEAAALGVPLAVTTPGGVADIVEPEYPRLHAGDAFALADAVLTRLCDLATSRAVAERVARRVVAQFSPDAMAQGYVDAYRCVLRHERSAA